MIDKAPLFVQVNCPYCPDFVLTHTLQDTLECCHCKREWKRPVIELERLWPQLHTELSDGRN